MQIAKTTLSLAFAFVSAGSVFAQSGTQPMSAAVADAVGLSGSAATEVAAAPASAPMAAPAPAPAPAAGTVSAPAARAAVTPAKPVANSGVKPGNVTTVESVLSAENKAMLAALNPTPVATAATPASRFPALHVAAIYGLGNDLKTDVSLYGKSYEGLRVGSKLGSWTVGSIKGKCVSLVKRKAKPLQSCWTGVSLPVVETTNLGATSLPSRAGMPGAVGTPLLPQGLPTGLLPAPLQEGAR